MSILLVPNPNVSIIPSAWVCDAAGIQAALIPAENYELISTTLINLNPFPKHFSLLYDYNIGNAFENRRGRRGIFTGRRNVGR